MKDGAYKVMVHCFAYRGKNNPINVQIECNGEVYDFTHKQADLIQNKSWEVIEFHYSHKNGLTFDKEPEGKVVSKEVWGIHTNRFHKVSGLSIFLGLPSISNYTF
jgi:hypothetical protein